MFQSVNKRVVGATLVGMALVLGALVAGRLESVPAAAESALYVAATEAPARTAITVADRDSNGIEDWQEPFLTAAPVLLNSSSTDYERDNTVTEQVSIALMENYLASQGLGTNSLPNDVLIKQATTQAFASTVDKTYLESDITVLTDFADTQIREYGNAAASVITNNNLPGMRNELLILDDAVRTKDKIHFDQLKQKAQMYATIRDTLIALPVPATLSKEHLALINASNALSNGLYAMIDIETDPLKSLLRIQRYQEDAGDLAFAMQGMYLKLEAYPTLFTGSDPALLFSLFASVQRRTL